MSDRIEAIERLVTEGANHIQDIAEMDDGLVDPEVLLGVAAVLVSCVARNVGTEEALRHLKRRLGNAVVGPIGAKA